MEDSNTELKKQIFELKQQQSVSNLKHISKKNESEINNTTKNIFNFLFVFIT